MSIIIVYIVLRFVFCQATPVIVSSGKVLLNGFMRGPFSRVVLRAGDICFICPQISITLWAEPIEIPNRMKKYLILLLTLCFLTSCQKYSLSKGLYFADTPDGMLYLELQSGHDCIMFFQGENKEEGSYWISNGEINLISHATVKKGSYTLGGLAVRSGKELSLEILLRFSLKECIEQNLRTSIWPSINTNPRRSLRWALNLRIMCTNLVLLLKMHIFAE